MSKKNVTMIIKRAGLCLVIFLFLFGTAIAGRTIVHVGALQPTWTLGVYSAYYGPPDYNIPVSPGLTGVYLGRQAGIIKAGLKEDPGGGYWDEGLFAFKPSISIEELANLPLTYDVVNQYGTNPVWMTIELDTGVIGNRNDNVTYQSVPAAYESTDYVTVDAGVSSWIQWADNSGNTTGDYMTLPEIAEARPGVSVIRAYLRLGMGDSYGPGPNGTQAWVDKVTIGGVTYDFVTRGDGYSKKDWSANPGNHGFQNP